MTEKNDNKALTSESIKKFPYKSILQSHADYMQESLSFICNRG